MNISQAAKDLIIKEPFYGFFLLNLNKYYTNKISTLAIGLKSINIVLYINETFWSKLTDLEQIASLKHELMHICFHHLTLRTEFSDKEVFNIAADCEINQYIENLPIGCIDVKKFNNFPLKAGTKIYYDLLIKDQNKIKKIIKNLISSGNIDEDGKIHPSWNEFNELENVEKELIKNQIDNILKEAAKQTIKNRGFIPGELKIYIDELFVIKKSIFNWKSYLRRLLGTSIYTYKKNTNKRPSKRFDEAKGLKNKYKHNILVAIDTSNSVNNTELLEFFSEIYHIYKAGANIKIIECDFIIQRIYDYNGIFDHTIKGRGGTSFNPVIDYYNNNIDTYTTLVYFTDGEASLNFKLKKQMIWVISSNGDQTTKYPGITIRIPQIQ